MHQSSHRSNSVVLLLALAVAGCVSDAAYAPPPVTDPTKLFWSLTLDHRAVTLSTVAPYDTIQLTATPRTVKGEAITGLPTPTFTSLDLDHVQVSANGLVHAIASGSQSAVVASLSIGNDTHVDTVIVNVTDTTPPPVLSVFTIHPDSGDSAKTAIDDGTTLQWRAFDPAGNPITGLSVYYATSDSTIATIDRVQGLLNPIRPGHVTLYATATAYGITKADTLPYTIGYPLLVQVNIVPEQNSAGKTVGVYQQTRLRLGPGATVLFINATAPLTDVTFDNPTNVDQNDQYCAIAPSLCGGGSIAAFARDPNDSTGVSYIRARQFPVPGTYPFHSTISGAKGTIVVMTQ